MIARAVPPDRPDNANEEAGRGLSRRARLLDQFTLIAENATFTRLY
jgi:hypothetical protein